MENHTGTWIGELEGPNNKGSMVMELQHEGDRIYGKGTFNEPALGSYQYQIQGVVIDSTVKLVLTPMNNHSPRISLGNVEATADLDSTGKMIGNWHSSLGLIGTFYVSRTDKPSKSPESDNNSVFIVHGHDEATKEKVARVVEKLGLNAIILHEQVSKGMTVIEKFEEYSKKAGFAIVLFTPDDIAYPMGKEEQKSPRARQNVVLEMGYFVGLLSREKVCVLYKGDLELPSDILGVVYTKVDESEAWKLTLAKELKSAGYEIDLNKLMP